jgi:hypothetical protein
MQRARRGPGRREKEQLAAIGRELLAIELAKLLRRFLARARRHQQPVVAAVDGNASQLIPIGAALAVHRVLGGRLAVGAREHDKVAIGRQGRIGISAESTQLPPFAAGLEKDISACDRDAGAARVRLCAGAIKPENRKGKSKQDTHRPQPHGRKGQIMGLPQTKSTRP